MIAASYARIFFRNAINIGLPILECLEAAEDITEGDLIDADVSTGRITNHTKNRQYQAQPLPTFVMKIAQAGGLVNFLKTHDVQDLMD